MDVFEFILILVGLIILGILGLVVVAGKYGLLDDEDEKNPKN